MSRYDAIVAVPNFAFTGGVYAYFVDVNTVNPTWASAMGTGGQTLDQTIFDPRPYQNQNPPLDPLDFFLGTPIARYEQLATTQQTPAAVTPNADTVYVSVIRQAGLVDVYRSTDRGQHWFPCYRGTQIPGSTNLAGGWLDAQKLTAPQPAGTYGGLGWGFGGAAKGLSCAPRDAQSVLLTNNGVLHKTITGGVGATANPVVVDWASLYTRPVTQGAARRWKTTGLEVTSTWRYVIHPTKPGLHFICATDIGLARSDDGTGENWASISQAKQATSNRLDTWHNWYDLAFGTSAIWAAVSTQHDLPHEKDLGHTGTGGIVQSDDEGQTWRRIGLAAGLPNHPVVSLIYVAGPPARLYASVWGNGVYRSDVTLVGGVETPGAWTALTTQSQSGAAIPTAHSYRIQYHAATQTLYWLVSGHDVGSMPHPEVGSGLYSLDLTVANPLWAHLTQGLVAALGQGNLYPVDFAVRDVPAGGRHLYLCTSKFVNGPDGKVWKFDGANWFDLHAPQPGNYFNQSNWFAPFFIGDLCFVTATSHGLWYARVAEADQATAAISPNWVEYPALNYIRIQRLQQTPEATLHITTFGGGLWGVRRHCFLVMNRSTFSREAVAAGGSPFADAFYLIFEGLAPQELGITNQANGLTGAPPIVLRDDAGAVIPNALARATAVSYLPENSQLATSVPQRLTFIYQMEIPSAAVFGGIGAGGQRRVSVTAAKDVFVCTGEIRLVVAGSPYLLDGATPWLSEDLRVFTVDAGATKFGYTIPANATQDDARTYIANILRGYSTLAADFGLLPTDTRPAHCSGPSGPTGSRSSISPSPAFATGPRWGPMPPGFRCSSGFAPQRSPVSTTIPTQHIAAPRGRRRPRSWDTKAMPSPQCPALPPNARRLPGAPGG